MERLLEEREQREGQKMKIVILIQDKKNDDGKAVMVYETQALRGLKRDSNKQKQRKTKLR